jgi:hypothetical protein
MEADEGTSEREEGLMKICVALVSDGQAAAAVEPSERALDDPAMAPEPLARLDAASRQTRCDPSLAASGAAEAMVIGFVAVKLIRPPSWSAPRLADRRDRVEGGRKDKAVVGVGRAYERGERGAVAVDHNVALRARLAAIRRVRPGFVAPLFAGTAALSSEARLQSMRFASPKRFSSSRCRRSHRPASCQSCNRRQQVMPEPQPISLGSISQGMPLLSTNKRPVRAARFGIGGRPPFGLGGSGGSSGATIAHSSSETRGLAMLSSTEHDRLRSWFC